jgi:hypothetical protein
MVGSATFQNKEADAIPRHKRCFPKALRMGPSRRHTVIALIAFALCMSGQASHAVILDWSTVTWPAGSLNNSYHVDPSVPGNNLTVDVSGNTGQLLPSFSPPNAQTPVVSQTFQGGFGSPQSSLELRVDYTSTAQFVTITINFSAAYAQGVTNVSLSLFDIDSGTYQDQIRNITALSIDGTTQVAPTISGLGASVSLTGTGLTQTLDGIATVPDTGAGSGDGNATITFNAAIQSLTFTYGSGPSAPADPTTQKIGIYNLIYSVVPIPEINPTAASALVCLLAVTFAHVRRRPLK